MITEIIHEGEFKADVGSKQTARIMGSSEMGVKTLCLLGLGPDPKKDAAGAGDMEVQSANLLGKVVGSIVKDGKLKSAGELLSIMPLYH